MLERLERIERLDRALAPAGVLLDELRALVAEAERWARREGVGEESVERCRQAPLSVAEVAAELDLPLGVVRVLIGDLLDAELVRVSRPVPPAELPDEQVLREVIHGLRAL